MQEVNNEETVEETSSSSHHKTLTSSQRIFRKKNKRIEQMRSWLRLPKHSSNTGTLHAFFYKHHYRYKYCCKPEIWTKFFEKIDVSMHFASIS